MIKRLLVFLSLTSPLSKINAEEFHFTADQAVLGCVASGGGCFAELAKIPVIGALFGGGVDHPPKTKKQICENMAQAWCYSYNTFPWDNYFKSRSASGFALCRRAKINFFTTKYYEKGFSYPSEEERSSMYPSKYGSHDRWSAYYDPFFEKTDDDSGSSDWHTVQLEKKYTKTGKPPMLVCNAWEQLNFLRKTCGDDDMEDFYDQFKHLGWKEYRWDNMYNRRDDKDFWLSMPTNVCVKRKDLEKISPKYLEADNLQFLK